VFAVTLAITQMGGERGKGVLDFQLTLPYSRGEMFITKLTLGLFYIITSIVISFSLTGFILEFSQAQHGYFSQFYIHLIVTVIMSYTITLAVGSFTGNLFAQGLTALGIAVLPFFLFLILSTHGAIVYSEWLNRANSPFDQIIDKIVQFAPIYYAFYGDLFAQYENLHVWIPLWFSLMFTIIGYFAFIHQPYERNGNFFLWMQLNRPVQLLVIIIGVLGFGAFGYYSSGESTGGYLVGAIVGATVGFIFSYFTIFRKSKRS
jgi:acetoin utilization transport system permease protein